jgi:hypothetical protein
MGSAPVSTGWRLARALLIASLVPLAVAMACFLVPVDNPGVQQCGSPLVFGIQSPGNDRVARDGLDEATFEARRAQATCTERVDDRLRIGFLAGAVFILLAFTGAVVGIVDDRLRYRRAPGFETLLRERPTDPSQPGRSS